MRDIVEQIYDELNAQVVRMLEHSQKQAQRISELEAQLAASHAVVGQQWISVKDRLPENDIEVLVWPHPTEEGMTASIRRGKDWGYMAWEDFKGWGWNKYDGPSHWAPINPPAPQPAQQEGGNGK